jgi:hypothetical protein
MFLHHYLPQGQMTHPVLSLAAPPRLDQPCDGPFSERHSQGLLRD